MLGQFSNVGGDGRIWFKTSKGKNMGLANGGPGDPQSLNEGQWYDLEVDRNSQPWSVRGWRLPNPSTIPGGSNMAPVPSNGTPMAAPAPAPQRAPAGPEWRVDAIAVTGVLKSLIEAGRIETTDDLGIWARAAFLALSSAPSKPETEPDW